MHHTAPPPHLDRLPHWIDSILGRCVIKPLFQAPLMQFAEWLTVASLPHSARELLCLPWTARDELVYRVYLKAAHAAVVTMPENRQFHPVAQQARKHWFEHGAVEPILIPAHPGLNHGNPD
jgi:uncharacterized protein (DUF2236 family)